MCIRGVEVYIHSFLTSTLDGGDWLTLYSGGFAPRKGSGTDWKGSWVGPKIGSEHFGAEKQEKRKCAFWETSEEVLKILTTSALCWKYWRIWNSEGYGMNVVEVIRVEWMFLSNTTYFIWCRGLFTLLPKIKLHVSALDNNHLQVVNEFLESSYIRFNMGCVQWGCGGRVGHEISYVSWRLVVWVTRGNCYYVYLI